MKLQNKIKGTLYGQAIGDALGLSTEFMSKAEVQAAYPHGINDYQDAQINPHTERWERGEWTDDTDQMLCILDAILKDKSLTIAGVSQKFMDWYNDMPMGIGNTVYNVLSNENFLQQPHQVAKQVWEDTDRNGAANGGVMRTSILGIWQYDNFEQVAENAKQVCQITHYDPRCVASCVAVSIAISAMLQGYSSIETIIEKSISFAKKYEPSVESILQDLPQDIGDLKLDEFPSIGYTYKALAAGFWVLKYSHSFEEGLKAIIHEGGDADTNASVGGALLGAKFGYDAIPEHWKTGLYQRQELDNRIDALLKLMG